MTPDEELAELRRAAEADIQGVGFDIFLNGGPGHQRQFHVRKDHLPLVWRYPVPVSLSSELLRADSEPLPSAAHPVARYVPANMVTDDGLHIYRFTEME